MEQAPIDRLIPRRPDSRNQELVTAWNDRLKAKRSPRQNPYRFSYTCAHNDLRNVAVIDRDASRPAPVAIADVGLDDNRQGA